MKSILASGWRVSRQAVQGASRSVYLFLVSGFWILSSFSTQAITDTNNNGLSDLWEKQFNNDELLPPSFDPLANGDGDDFTNEREAAAGTDPFSGTPPEGFLTVQITHVPAVYGPPLQIGGDPTVISPEAIVTEWPTLPGKQYTLYASPDLSAGSWLQVDTPHYGDGDNIQVGLTPMIEGVLADKYFYRVAINDIDQDYNGLTDAEEHALGIAPGFADVNANGLPDDWETANAGTFAAYPPVLADRVFQNQESPQSIHLRNDTDVEVNYTASLTGSMGPGYSVKDSITGNISYAWEDISSTGTLLPIVSDADDASETVIFSGGFSFPFYGQNFSEVSVCSNGFLNFGTGHPTTLLNTTLPNSSAPANLIAALWDDLDNRSTGDVYYKQESDRLIVQYQDVGKYNSTGTHTFQIILFSDGRILIRYHTLTAATNSCTVGVQNATGTQGSLILFNPAYAYLANAMAIEMKPASGIFTVTPSSGSVPAHSVMTISGSFQPMQSPAGVYYPYLTFSHDGVGTNPQHVIARLDVIAEDSDGDGIPNDWEIANALNPTLDDASGDLDSDGLSNLQEYEHGTKINTFDSDGDKLPDLWEITYGLDPLSADGDNGANGDIEVDGIIQPQAFSTAAFSMSTQTQKGDGVANRDEFQNGTDPTKSDTDGDGTSDFDEITQGSNPTSSADGGQLPPDPVEDVEFKVFGDYASWRMEIKSLGPRDTRTLLVVSPAPGQPDTKSHKLWKNNKYEITLHHTGSKADVPDIWYCWEAIVDGEPTAETYNTLPNYQIGERNSSGTFFIVKNHWVVDNRDGLLTSHLHSKGANHAAGKKAFLVPVHVDDNLFATGVDDVSTTADPADIGYQEDFWIMAPCGGEAYNNDMRFKIPLDPAADLKIEPALSTSAPDTTSLSNAIPGPIVTWSGNGAESIDDTPIWKIGDVAEPVELPISVKTMKKRTVKVSCYMVRTPGSTNNITTCGKQSLENLLNRVFGWQVNAWFDVTVHTDVVHSVDFDLDNNGRLLSTDLNGNTSVEEQKILDNVQKDANADIHIFYVNRWLAKSTDPPVTLDEVEIPSNIMGVAPRNGNNIFLSLRTFPYTEPQILRTVAHEIGHVMCGEGHPNQNGGPAPLLGTDRTKRLMSTTILDNPESIGLVKKEWDKADAWLRTRPNGDN